MKKKNRLLRFAFVLAFLVSLGLGNELRAATVTFVGSAVDTWGAAGANTDWSSGTTPTANDDVIIPTGYAVTSSAAIVAKSITIEGNSSLTIGHATDIALAAPGGITLNGTSTLTVNAGVNFTIGDATYRGDIVLNDNSTLAFATAQATFSLSGTFTKGDDATITINAAARPNTTLTGSTDVTLPSTFTSTGTLTINKTGASVTQTGNMTVNGAFDNTNGTYNVGEYTFAVTGASTLRTGTTFNGFSATGKTRNMGTSCDLIGTAVLNLSGTASNTITALDFSTTAGGTVNLTGSTTTITTVAATVAGTINASGSSITFNGASVFSTLITDANTSLSITTTNDNVTLPSSVTSVLDLIINKSAVGDAVTLSANLSVARNLTVTRGRLNLTNRTVVVNGAFSKAVVANAIVEATGANITFNGNANFANTTNAGFVTNNTTSITFGGTGTISNFLGTGGNTLYSLTYNRIDADTVTAGNQALTLNAALTVENAVTINSGEISLGGAVNLIDLATTTTSIGANGKLTIGGAILTFLGTVTGNGILDASNAADEVQFPAPTYSFIGNLMTSVGTILQFNKPADATNYTVELNSSVTALENLDLLEAGAGAGYIILKLNNDLTLAAAGVITPDAAAAAATAASDIQSGKIVVNGKKLTLSGIDAGNPATLAEIDVTAGSTLVFATAEPTFTNVTITEDETTNFEFAITLSSAAANYIPATITKCNNLSITAAVTVISASSLDINGNLDIMAGAAYDMNVGNVNLTVRGDIANAGTIDATAQTLTLYGSMQGEGVYTTTATSNVVVNGTGAQLIFPATFVGPIGTLTLNRPAGAVLNSNITIGAAGGATDLVITKGNLDLNGYVIELGAPTATMTEASPYRVINTGATSATQGYITTEIATGSTKAELEASGIGVQSITDATATLVVRRYPKVVPIPGIGLAVSRYYQVLEQAGGAINTSVISLYFDNTELNSPIEGLKLYHSTSDAFTIKTETTGTLTQNSPTGKGYLSATPTAAVTAASYFALAGLPGNGGVMRTFNLASGTSGNWSNASNWSPVGVPTKFDQAVIGPYTVVIDGNGQDFYCASLTMNHALATLKPFDNGVNGDIVTLNVLGDINISQPGASIDGANNYGRLNLTIGDGLTAGVTSNITVPVSYSMVGSDGNGMWIHDFAVKSATVGFNQAVKIRVTGDLSVTGNSSIDFAHALFYGGYNNSAAQVISADNSAYLKFQNTTLENNANVTTEANIEQVNTILVNAGSQFVATNGTVSFPTAPITCWNVLDGGILTLNNVDFTFATTGNAYTPLGTVTIKGNFTKSGESEFTATSGKVIFSNSTQKELTNSGSTPADLQFYNLQVLPGSAITTSSSFHVASEIDVQVGASLKADNGTITMSQAAPAIKWIKNASTQTLEFNNLDIADGTVYTNDSWTVRGNLGITTSLLANNGTITFENTQEKTITNGGTLEFFKIKVADNSKVTTVNNGFTIKNNATYMTGAGLEVANGGQFKVGGAGHIVTFDAGVGVTVGNPKTITNNGTLKFGNLTLAASPNNEVTTASNFEIIGTGGAGNGFINSGAGGNFTATAGEVTFSGATPYIVSVSPAVTNFYGIKTTGATILTLTAAQEIHVRGNIAINGTSSFAPGDVLTSKIIFDGTTQQTVGGTTTVIDGINLGNVVLNKGIASYTNDDEVLLTANVYNSGVLTLTNGILNLGSNIFKVASQTISRANGVINGATGTYLVTGNHQATLLSDAYFTLNDTPTLYNLQIDVAHATSNDLTVNGNLNLNNGAFTIATGTAATPKWLKVKGNLLRTAGTFTASLTESKLILEGTGTVIGGLSNAFFTGAAATTANLEIARAEVLGGNLNIGAKSDLTINTGINNFDLSAYTLTFANDALNTLTIKSGAIKAGTNSKVVFGAAGLSNSIPANTFVNNEVYDITIAAATTIKSDLKINGTWAGAFSIATGDNVLSLAKTATIPALSTTSYVRGNLRRVVTSSEVAFPVGDAVLASAASAYRPISLQFSTLGSEQEVTVRTNNIDPTIGRGGNPKNAVNIVWSITPEGTDVNDAMKVKFQWNSFSEESANSGQVALANASFPAKWSGSNWIDYRNNLSNFTVADPRILTMNSFAVANPTALKGDWAVFNATANTNAAKDAAISLTQNRVVITSITPNPVIAGTPFKVTVQLQDQYGQPINANTDYSINMIKHQGAGTLSGTPIVGVIPAGNSLVTFTGLTFTGSGQNHQLIADTTGSSANWQAGLSPVFSVLPSVPAGQASGITFTNIAQTTMSISWTDPGLGNQRTIVMMKANNSLEDNEYPVNGETYVANNVFGAGSSIGEAVVVYNGDASAGTNTINVSGLAPNTKYNVYAFVYAMADNEEGTENYRRASTNKNPNSETTIGGTDDDVAFGTNNTRTTSKTIGTNTPVTGTIGTSTDEDWFNFSVTSASPNVRTQLYGLANNYNIEVYDINGRRIRRGIRTATGSEGPVVNDLPAGTYTVRIYSADGSYSSTNTYTLKVGTKSSEIFSVTP